MTVASDSQNRPDASSEARERARRELVKRILKLRWARMDSEAQCMETALQDVAAEDTLLAGPFDTD